jgi:hypothetical protein
LSSIIFLLQRVYLKAFLWKVVHIGFFIVLFCTLASVAVKLLLQDLSKQSIKSQIMTRHGDVPPVYRIDLSLPPRKRYVELARLYRDQLRALTGLFDELVDAFLPGGYVQWIRKLARLSLRRLYTTEETEEIRGISQAVDVDMYLLVAFNVLLDLLMGCTSGGVRARTEESSQTKMLHFRTLDWGMDALRKVVVQLEYVTGPDTDEVLATSITYVGFVGVLTAVRKGLSVSLNFRPMHDASRRWTNYRFYFSHLLVLLGTRRSISSLLRQCILPEASNRSCSRRSWRLSWWSWKSDERPISALTPPSLASIQDRIPSEPTTAAYLIFSDGTSTVTMEKDHRTAVVRSSSSFIAITNSDQESDAPSAEQVARDKVETHAALGALSGEFETVADIIAESNDRLACMGAQWDKKVRRAERATKKRLAASAGQQEQTGARRQQPGRLTKKNYDGSPDLRLRKKSDKRSPRGEEEEEEEEEEEVNNEPGEIAATTREVIKWLSTYPVTNETTHFAAIMDPTEGKVVWMRRYPVPIVPDG